MESVLCWSAATLSQNGKTATELALAEGNPEVAELLQRATEESQGGASTVSIRL
jgi:hypothetical protein